jgi:hypothetical protein
MIPNKQDVRKEIIPAFREKLKPVEIVSPAPAFKEDRGQSSTEDMESNTMPSSSEHRLPRSPLASYQAREADLVFEKAGSKKPDTQRRHISPFVCYFSWVMLDARAKTAEVGEAHAPQSVRVTPNRNTFDTKLP